MASTSAACTPRTDIACGTTASTSPPRLSTQPLTTSTTGSVFGPIPGPSTSGWERTTRSSGSGARQTGDRRFRSRPATVDGPAVRTGHRAPTPARRGGPGGSRHRAANALAARDTPPATPSTWNGCVTPASAVASHPQRTQRRHRPVPHRLGHSEHPSRSARQGVRLEASRSITPRPMGSGRRSRGGRPHRDHAGRRRCPVAHPPRLTEPRSSADVPDQPD
jgi:hypothetical protein